MATSSRPLGGAAGDVFEYLTGESDDEEEGPRRPTGPAGDGIGPDYYLGGGQSHGAVWGRGADRLGVSELTREQFINLAEGRSLDGASQLIQTQNGKHVAGIDVNMSAPKSVSTLLITATDDERDAIEAAWLASVREGFDGMERHARVSRRTVKTPTEAADDRTTKTQGSTTERTPADLLAFIALHHTARPTAETEERGAPPDPHLHAHAFVFNVAFVPDEHHPEGGKWRGVDDWGIKHQAEEREATVMGGFARRLEDLGYRLDYTTDRKGRTRWEVADADPETLRHFSSNARRADRLAREFERKRFRPPTPAEMRDEMRRTRLRKNHAHEHAPAWSDLLTDALRHGLKLPMSRPGRPIQRATMARRLSVLRERLNAPAGLCRDDALFDRDSVRTAVARCAVGLGLLPDELDSFAAEFIASELVVVRPGGPGRELFDYLTTKANLDNERFIATTAEAKAGEATPAPPPDAVERAIAMSDIDLDDEQRALIRAACEPAGWLNVEGYAGTGKTSALRSVVAAYRDRRSTGRATADAIVALSTAAATAERTGRKLEADAWHSVEAFVEAVRKGKLRPTSRTVIVLDEAVMVDTPRMAALLKAAGPAKIICVGDPKQLQAIGAGGWYADQADRIGRVTLSNVHRHTDQADVDTFELLRNGDAMSALTSLDERGRVHCSPTRAERMGKAVADYVMHRDCAYDPSDLRIVLDGSNQEVDTANRLIQDDRRRRHELTGQGMAVSSTAEDRSWTLYAGDEVMFLASYWDGRTSVRNGVGGVIAELDATAGVVVVRTDDGQDVTVELSAEAATQPLGLRYAMHATKLQGGEVAVIFSLPGKHTTSLEAGYSQLTRCIEAAHVYVDHETHGLDALAGLATAWRTARPKVSARKVLGEQAPFPFVADLDLPTVSMPTVDLTVDDGEDEEVRRRRRREREQRPEHDSVGLSLGLSRSGLHR